MNLMRMLSAGRDAMTAENRSIYNVAHQKTSRYIIIFSAFISFVSLSWFGINNTLGFWQELIDLTCALVLGVIYFRDLEKLRVVLIILFFGVLWITSRSIGIYHWYQKAVARDQECDIYCATSDPLICWWAFIIIVILVYLYTPVTEQIKKYLIKS